ncbi:Hypothetical predicted protein [Pelobates cultripes]|uniref:Uncharacterized protein n=1 Tax=Pelobates cultripes TaxID=61616 RepID=A0AAD1S942_PELCU|nr:Hypothetical predicted protein [Pelobates cultripes]
MAVACRACRGPKAPPPPMAGELVETHTRPEVERVRAARGRTRSREGRREGGQGAQQLPRKSFPSDPRSLPVLTKGTAQAGSLRKVGEEQRHPKGGAKKNIKTIYINHIGCTKQHPST